VSSGNCRSTLRRIHRALIALVVVEQFHRQLQRRTNAKEAVGPTAHEHFPVALLLPDEVGDVENPGQAVHGLVASGQAVEAARSHGVSQSEIRKRKQKY